MKVLFLDIDGVLVVNGPDEGLTLAHFEPRALKEVRPCLPPWSHPRPWL